MKQLAMSKYIISFHLLFIVFFTNAQENTPDQKNIEINAITVKAKDSVVYKKKYGLRVGLDLSKPILSAIKDNFTAYELVGDYRLKKNFYIAAEIGYTDKNSSRDTYRFNTKGSYMTAGININTFENWLEMDNEIYIGARYGFSRFSQTVNTYQILQNGSSIDGISTPYFAPKEITTPFTYEKLSAHWFSMVIGFKVETLKNLYLGCSVQLNKMLFTKEPDNFKNLFVPGFDKVFASDSGISFNYTVSYRIPLYKK
ncbi:MAG: DUF6048 family protein [Flavicella sp.]